jgi:hypothetical protein
MEEQETVSGKKYHYYTHSEGEPDDGIGEESPNNPSFFHNCSGWSRYAKSEILNEADSIVAF